MQSGVSVRISDSLSRYKERTRLKLKDMKKRLRRCGWLYLFVVLPVITVFIFHYIPIYGVQIAFRDYSSKLGIWKSEWVGLKYFKRFVEYPYFWPMVRNTLRISLYGLAYFPVPIIFSLMLNELRNGKFKKSVQMLTYAPHFVSTVVTCSMVLLFLKRDGLINIIITALGGTASDIMANPAAFAPVYTISGMWHELGWGTIIYMAALSGVPSELIEAAQIDGAGRMQIIWHIDLPHLKPTIVTMFILKLGQLMSVGFEKVLLLQNDLNLDASNVISTYVYNIGIVGGNFSYSAAIGLFDNIVNIILVVVANRVSKKVAQVSLW